MLYFALALLNLDRLPIAWIDEVQLADVGRNLAETGRMFTKVWGLPGTEEVFMAYPPFTFYYHAFWQFLLPSGMFWVRLPFLLAFPICLYYLHLIFTRHFNLSKSISFLLLLIFSIDRGIFESLRSYRVEVLELALLAPAFYYFLSQKRPVLVALLCTLTALGHLSMLPLALLLWIFNFRTAKGWQQILISMLPVAIWMAITGFNLPELYNQMFALGGEHTPGGNLFYNHFIGRFFPYYGAQPLVPILFWAAHIWCIYQLWRKMNLRQSATAVLFLATSLYWLLMLGPFYRYNTPLILLMFLLMADFINHLKSPKIKWVQIILALYLLLPLSAWALRHAVAIAERPQRDIVTFNNWLNKNIGPRGEKILIIGHAGGFYFAQASPNVHYASIYSVRNHRMDEYDRVYYAPDAGREYDGELISTLEISPLLQLPDALKGITYNGAKLYRLSTEAEMKKIQSQYPW